MGGFEIFQQGFCRQEVNWAGLGKAKQGLVFRNEFKPQNVKDQFVEGCNYKRTLPMPSLEC